MAMRPREKVDTNFICGHEWPCYHAATRPQRLNFKIDSSDTMQYLSETAFLIFDLQNNMFERHTANKLHNNLRILRFASTYTAIPD